MLTFSLRMGKWKGIRNEITKRPDAPIELYDLERDVSETTDVATANPEIVKRIAALMRTERTPAVLPEWNFERSSPLTGISTTRSSRRRRS